MLCCVHARPRSAPARSTKEKAGAVLVLPPGSCCLGSRCSVTTECERLLCALVQVRARWRCLQLRLSVPSAASALSTCTCVHRQRGWAPDAWPRFAVQPGRLAASKLLAQWGCRSRLGRLTGHVACCGDGDSASSAGLQERLGTLAMPSENCCQGQCVEHTAQACARLG